MKLIKLTSSNAFGIIFLFFITMLLFRLSKHKCNKPEGFGTDFNTYSISDGVRPSWEFKSKGYNKDDTSSEDYAIIDLPCAARDDGPYPDSQMFMFNNTKFGANCCPSAFNDNSGSNGCACLSEAQSDTLFSRGGNRLYPNKYVENNHDNGYIKFNFE